MVGALFSTGIWLAVALLAGAGAILLLGVVFAGPDRAVERHLHARLGSYARVRDSGTGRFLWLSRFSRRAERAAERGGLLRGIDALLEQSNLPLSAGEAVLAVLAAAVLFGGVAGVAGSSAVLALIVAAGVVVLAVIAVRTTASRERRRFEGQLPDTLNLLATSLRAGYSLLQSAEAVATQTPDPTGREFGRAMSEVRLGRAVVDALQSVAERMQSEDFAWAVMAIEIQREVGGNLAEVLTSASATLIARTRLRREVRALTAEGRLTAIILSVLPFGLAAFIYSVNPDYLSPLFEEPLGVAAIIGAGVLMVFGIFWLRRVVDVEI